MGWKEDRRAAYSEKLKDPRWQKKRLEVFNRDNWTCQYCGEITKTLNVHHLEYEAGKQPWEYCLSQLVTTCQDCHQLEYENRKVAEDGLIRRLRISRLSAEDIEMLTTAMDLFHEGRELVDSKNLVKLVTSFIFQCDWPADLCDAKAQLAKIVASNDAAREEWIKARNPQKEGE